MRQGGRNAPLGTHLNYLRREGVTRDGEKARLFGPGGDDADPKAFADASAKLTAAQAAKAKAEDEWLALELIREEIDSQ